MFEFKYYLKRYFFLFCHVLLGKVLAVVYWGRKKTVPPVKNLLLLKSARTLAKEIRERKIKCEDVIKAYIERILEVEPYINAVVQDNFEDALRESQKVDAFIESGAYSVKELSEEKPLFGVPFTAKCCFSVKGFQHTAGCLLFKDKIATDDAQSVTLLKKAGGIFLALTNVPELTCSMESSNYLYGRTCNPYDSTKTCGGSSGGEAALIAAAGSVIGLGNDLYGSNRISASFCGIFGCKPTTGWTSLDGLLPKRLHSLENYLSTGPLCRYSEDLAILLNVLSINQKSIEVDLQVNFKKIKIYYQTDIKYVWNINTEREIAQAVRNAAFHFKQTYGVEIKEVDVPLLNKTNATALHVFRKGVSESQLLKHATDGRVEKLNKITEFFKMIFGKCQFTPIGFIILTMFYSSIFFNEKDINHYEKIHKELVEEFEKLLDEDAVFLCPTTPDTAGYHHQWCTHYFSGTFLGIFNLIGFPATHCPMGIGNKKLPIGIQIASCKGNDALTFACANELEKVFGGWIPPQQNPK